MYFTVKNLIKSSAIYSVGHWGNALLGIILIPIYTRIFSPADYGVIDLIAATTALLVIVLQLGIDDAVTRFFCDTESEKEKERIASTAFLFKLCTYIPVLGIGIILSKEISIFLFRDPSYAGLLSWSFGTVLATGLYFLLISLLRFQFKTVLFALLNFLQILSQLLLTVYFVVWLRTGIVGIYWAAVISIGSFTTLLFILNRRYLCSRWSSQLLRVMFVFGIWVVPSNIAYFSMQYLDRFFIAHFRDLSELGLYGIGYKPSLVIYLATVGFNLAWGPYVYSSFSKPGARETIARVLNYYNSIMTTIAVGISLFAVELLKVLTTPEYYGAARVVGIVTFGVLVFQVTDYFCVGIGIAKKMHIRMWSGLIAMGVNCLLNWLLIPRYGMIGAAWATLISYAIYGIIVMIGSEVSFHIPYQYFPNLALWLIGAGVVVLERFWLGQLPISPTVIGIKVLLVVGFFLLTFKLKLIPSYVIRAAINSIRGRNNKTGPQR